MRSLFIYLVLFFFLHSCMKEEIHEPKEKPGIRPIPPSDVDVDNRNGKSIIYYTIDDSAILYVMAEYKFKEGGELKHVKSSRFRNSLVLDGFPTAGAYEVKLYGVSPDELKSDPVTVTVNPLTPPIEMAFKSMAVNAGFGGLNLKAKNEFLEDMVFEMMVKDDRGEWTDWDSYYTKLPEINYTSTNLTKPKYDMAFYVRDRWENISDTLFKVVEPLEEAKINVAQGGYLHYSLPTDIPNASPPIASGWGFDKLFDGSLGTTTGNVFFKNGATVMPFHFSIDLKAEYELSKMKLFQRTPAHGGGTAYGGSNVKKFQVWGSTSPNPSGVFDASWILLGTFENIKASGLPSGSTTQEDRDRADAGESYYFDPNGVAPTPSVRYIRFQMLENWGATSAMHMAEMEIYGAKKK